MNDAELRARITEILETDTGSDDDKVQRRARWAAVAEAAVQAGPGDIVEIGALAGDSTVLFCDIAERYGRKVLVVDPWIAPTINVSGWEHDAFMERTKRWWENGVLSIKKDLSQSAPMIEFLQNGTWAFALVDGSHKEPDVLCDAMAVRGARVIGFDDLNAQGVRRSFLRAGSLLGRLTLEPQPHGKKWEGYLAGKGDRD